VWGWQGASCCSGCVGCCLQPSPRGGRLGTGGILLPSHLVRRRETPLPSLDTYTVITVMTACSGCHLHCSYPVADVPPSLPLGPCTAAP
jgi:hypothetical protein